jgi:hypothetical protein
MAKNEATRQIEHKIVENLEILGTMSRSFHPIRHFWSFKTLAIKVTIRLRWFNSDQLAGYKLETITDIF